MAGAIKAKIIPPLRGIFLYFVIKASGEKDLRDLCQIVLRGKVCRQDEEVVIHEKISCSYTGIIDDF